MKLAIMQYSASVSKEKQPRNSDEIYIQGLGLGLTSNFFRFDSLTYFFSISIRFSILELY